MMDPLFLSVLSVGSTVCAIVFGYAAFSRNRKNDDKQTGAQSAVLLTELGYVKSGIDDIKRKQSEIDDKYAAMSERVVKVEESAVQAHKRIDTLTGNGRA